MTETTAGPRRALVLGACGHWWRESQPDGFQMTDQPRVCTACQIGVRDDDGYSSQGFRLVPVTYVTSWTEHNTKEN
jgi:hypothetical protein